MENCPHVNTYDMWKRCEEKDTFSVVEFFLFCVRSLSIYVYKQAHEIKVKLRLIMLCDMFGKCEEIKQEKTEKTIP